MRKALLIVACLALSGCSQANQELGVAPAMSPVGYGVGANGGPSKYSYPTPSPKKTQRFSLWDDSQSKLFTDARALNEGDILTVRIQINDSARFQNESERSRTNSRGFGLGASLGWDGFSTGGSGEADIDSDSSSRGTGETLRSESLRLSVAAVVTDVLPNGNLVISGSQEVLVNYELRVLNIAGIVRPNDIDAYNNVNYERIAEARISYGGRGRLSEVQQPPIGHQVLDAVSPF